MRCKSSSRSSICLALFALGIACFQGFAISTKAQDIVGTVVLPGSPDVVTGTPKLPIVVPIFSDYVFPRYQSDDVLTQRNDNNRTGASHVAGINQNTVRRFRRLGSFPVNGVVLSQPLYVKSAMVNGVRQQVLIVATSNNDVYAFSPFENRPQPLWHRALGRPVVSRPGQHPPNAVGADCAPNALAAWQQPGTLAPGLEDGLIGIESTPVIDPGLGRVFVSYKTFDGLQHLAALEVDD